jgi:hypothetical protein
LKDKYLFGFHLIEITLQDHAPIPQFTETPSLGFQQTIDEPPFFMGSFVKK